MSGIPGSGKSTWIKNHKNYFSEDCGIISRDAVRFSIITNEDEYFSKENEVFAEFIRQIKESLNENIDTVVDATHINIGSRAKLLRALGASLKGVEINIIVINVSLGTALEQNSLREGRSLVPEGAVERMFDNFCMPSLEEGFDNIYIYENENGKAKYEIISKGVE